MTILHPAQSNTRGFTLIETIVYIGLFSILFTGIFMSMYPIFTGAERLTKYVQVEGESAFILSKIRYALAQGMSDGTRSITSPAEGATSDTLVIKDGSTELFRFEEDNSSTFCTPPRLCSFIVYGENSDPTTPLNNERVFVEDFSVRHVAPSGDVPRYLELTFTAGGVVIGPARYYVHF